MQTTVPILNFHPKVSNIKYKYPPVRRRILHAQSHPAAGEWGREGFAGYNYLPFSVLTNSAIRPFQADKDYSNILV